MKHHTIAIQTMSDNVAEHIVIDDSYDIVVIKSGKQYTLKVLKTMCEPNINVEISNFEEFAELLEWEEC